MTKESVAVVLLLINAVAVLIMYADKKFAIRREQRIPERTLMGFAVCFGSVGILLGMILFRHKTKHAKFSVGVPLILLIQILLVVLCLPKLT